ncbi:putative toxin-antitoxin system toxin component, PIN family [Rhodococcus triatomae]|uniref:putative toxin-antitoxin system toxin component, PIN family n=1 Tax=Rhodococcus triatomae TaxID=300028 RepID=UPI001473C456|nr:putative toxin-antitoxin system toxin component, PIN family [Rhodococcus triatomae]QNG19347.1 putative toxin-antitoxin system toxin component, PIN family [Rhodococcus triatomae]QNG24740.1 putative toxin-antitoxin system toxin component, PIN family [Rhodococcus triatomae]
MLDTNALISAALSPKGHSAQLIELARRGRISLIMSYHLCDELETRLERDKFRRWLSLDDVRDFVDAVSVVADWIDDRPDKEIPLVCDDPDDNYLVALFQDSDATMLVSGDKAVLRIDYPGLDVRRPAAAMEALDFVHEWGEGYMEGSEDRSFAQIEAEGNRGIFAAYSGFAMVIREPNARDLLQYVVVPETLRHFRKRSSLEWIRRELTARGMATRPIYASPDIAYIKLPPDPGTSLRAVGAVALPTGTIFATMQRCPDLPDLPGADFDHWRVFGIGGLVEPERIRPRPTRTKPEAT